MKPRTREEARNKALSKALADMVLSGREELNYEHAIDEFDRLWPVAETTVNA